MNLSEIGNTHYYQSHSSHSFPPARRALCSLDTPLFSLLFLPSSHGASLITHKQSCHCLRSALWLVLGDTKARRRQFSRRKEVRTSLSLLHLHLFLHAVHRESQPPTSRYHVLSVTALTYYSCYTVRVLDLTHRKTRTNTRLPVSYSSAPLYCYPLLSSNPDSGGVLEVLQGQQSQREGPVLLQHGPLRLQTATPCAVTAVCSLFLLLGASSEGLCCTYFHFISPCDQCCCCCDDRGCSAVQLKQLIYHACQEWRRVRLGQIRPVSQFL